LQAIFDEGLVLRHKKRALAAAVGGADFLLERAVVEMAERLSTVERRFDEAALLFCLTPTARAAVLASGKVGSAIRIELDESLLGGDAGRAGGFDHVSLAPASIDLAVSLLSLQEANDLPGTLIQIRRALRPDGLFLAAIGGGGTLGELRESLLAAETELYGGASPRVAPFTDVRDAGALLQRAGFALPVADVETITVRYASMFGLLSDLRAMGASNALAARTRRPGTRRLFARAAEIYAERFADPDGRVRATFSIVWMSGWAPHPSQQKPLQPGSAEVSLTKVLEERSG
jgi:SAM-dependent methyltransferase